MIILDNGHGKNTAGKRSPVWGDGSQLYEWEFNRDIVRRIAAKCEENNIEYVILVPEEEDISLAERCIRANRIYRDKGGILLSIHANAGGGTGWEAYTTPGETKADIIATAIYEEIKEMFPDVKLRTDTRDGDADKEECFYILKHSIAPAVLTENFFMDDFANCKLIMSEEGREKIAEAHFRAIKKILK